MRTARTVAQAKLNLFLRVLGRETSGYHALETLFQRVELGDVVTVHVDVTGRSLDCRGAEVGPVEQNLAWRAALAFAEATGWPGGFAIEVEKRIPVGGGLGGGSADAAAVLRLLNALAPSPLSPPHLLALALALGADVPFLASGAGRALAWGRGERLLALPSVAAAPVLLLLPDVSVPTAAAFGWLADDRGPYAPEARALSLHELSDWDAIARLAGNDFEAPVAARLPEVGRLAAARATLPEAGDAPLLYGMTGSGSTWFALSPDQAVADRLAAHLWPARVVQTRTAEQVVGVDTSE